jgi:hypothetical protein
MNFGKGGQNIVQAGNGNSSVFKGAMGNILGQYLGTKMRRDERDYHRQKDEESRIRVNKANHMDKAAADVFKSMVQPVAGAHGAAKAYDIANETYGESHPDVVAGKRQANEYVRPEMAHQVNEYGFDIGYRPATTPAGVKQAEARNKFRGGDESTKQVNGSSSKIDVSSAVASSPVGGFNPEENDIQTALHQNNTTNYFPFESTAGSSGKFSPTKFDNEQPVYSEVDAEEARASAAKTPFDTRAGYKERTAHLKDGINDGTGGNN